MLNCPRAGKLELTVWLKNPPQATAAAKVVSTTSLSSPVAWLAPLGGYGGCRSEGYIGIVPLATGLMGWCPAYADRPEYLPL